MSRGSIHSCSAQGFNYVMQVGATALFLLTELFLCPLNPGGCVVDISLTRWQMSQPDTESYIAAKGAVTALTHAMVQHRLPARFGSMPLPQAG